MIQMKTKRYNKVMSRNGGGQAFFHTPRDELKLLFLSFSEGNNSLNSSQGVWKKACPTTFKWCNDFILCQKQ